MYNNNNNNLNNNNMNPKERANILFNKYSKEYNRALVSGTMQQSEHWKEITKELTKLYKDA